MKTVNSRGFVKGDVVQWNWMGKVVVGVVERVYFRAVTKTLRGFEFRRNGSALVPAYSIKSRSGNEVLKLHSELRKSSALKKRSTK